MDKAELEGAASLKPTSTYLRRLCFLYEWLIGRELDLPDVVAGAYTFIVDTSQQYAKDLWSYSRRFRIKDSLPGGPDFCPLADRTQATDHFIGLGLDGRARALIESAPGIDRGGRSFSPPERFQGLLRHRGRASPQGSYRSIPLKGNQPTLEADVEAYFRTAPAGELVTKTTVEKGHGRIETRVFTASASVDRISSDRSYPGQPRFAGIKSVVKVDCRTEHADRSTFETRHDICSSKPDIERLANGVRGHWSVESMHWLLDVEFKDDLSRYRTGNGAKNMAVVRRFALNLVRINPQKGSVKTKRKSAGWNPLFLREILGLK